ncbi:bifunctional metallophosphatase/5'-nucleotidase [Weissella coleopterorum]|uniref:Bifunctional metallophosphatase/5'-nucleotidase n=1 Tax=Weissella coleopterorum TaxID=2714949 RepID=A0A6G8AZ99_9LACO|nr:bifunctional UDP-sugar hydrolase/5'-nucleotidase [Weissella coleopterorum]QIL50285.1 bifunctional metallophosphatase/5'-nucleotidase [Weissella coleopterorum]
MQVKILSTSDIHGYFNADDFRRPLKNHGFGLTRAVEAMQKEADQLGINDLIIRIDNGDFIQGSPLTNYLEKKEPQFLPLYDDLAKLARYDVRIIGNHEFNYGRDYLERALQANNVLNANIIDQATQKPFIGQPYQIFSKGKVKVGVIGLTTKFIPNWEPLKNIQGLIFEDPVLIAQKYIKIVQPQVDLLILAYHGGFERDLETGEALGHVTGENQGYELSQLSGVDALVTGHQHRLIAQQINGLVATQPGYRGEAIGVMDFTLNAGQLQTSRARLIATKSFPEEPRILTQIQPLQSKINQWLDQPIGRVGLNMKIINHHLARIESHPFVAFVNQVQMKFGKTQIANTAIFNNEVRGLPNCVTRRDIMTNYLYPNIVVVESLTGQEIVDAIEVSARYFQLNRALELGVNHHFMRPKVQHYNYDLWSGIEYTIDMRQPMNQRVKDVFFQGRPLQLERHYEVALNSYRANGAGNFKMYQANKIVREVPVEITDLMADYLEAYPDLEINPPHNIKVIGYQKLSSKPDG